MPFAQKILFYIPVVPLGAIMVFLTVVISIAGLLIVWRIVPRQLFKTHNDLASAIFLAIATAYTVLLAFVVVISWQNFDKAVMHTETEANCLVDLYRSSAVFGKTFENDSRSLIKKYVNVVINEEWVVLARGQESERARLILRDIWSLYESFEPKTEKEIIFFAESVRKLDDLREMRRSRIIDSRTGVHPVLWFVLIVGGILTISFTYFFGSEHFINHAIMASMLGALIALILLTILSFNFPFTGSVSIESKTFQQVISY